MSTVRINKILKQFAMPIDDLSLDPANERKHGKKNLDAIKGSIKKFGQQSLIVYDPENKCILKGNGTYTAMLELGALEIAAVPTDLQSNVLKAGYRLADNRSGELAEWDNDALYDTLKSLQADDFDVGDIGFDDWQASENEDELNHYDPSEKKYGFLIKCKNENEILKIQNYFNTTRSSIDMDKFKQKVSI